MSKFAYVKVNNESKQKRISNFIFDTKFFPTLSDKQEADIAKLTKISLTCEYTRNVWVYSC